MGGCAPHNWRKTQTTGRIPPPIPVVCVRVCVRQSDVFFTFAAVRSGSAICSRLARPVCFPFVPECVAAVVPPLRYTGASAPFNAQHMFCAARSFSVSAQHCRRRRHQRLAGKVSNTTLLLDEKSAQAQPSTRAQLRTHPSLY